MNIYPLVSVIVPIYNVEAFVRESIESISNQSYENIEIVLVDDGSTDRSGIICDEYALADERIKVIHKKNEGLVSARKEGVLNATGQYCMHIDGDDWIDNNTIEEMMFYHTQDEYDFVQLGYFSDSNRTKREVRKYIDVTDEDRSQLLENWLESNAFEDSAVVNKLYKTDFFKKCYRNVPNDFSLGEDQISYIYTLEIVGSFMLDNNIQHYHYRTREGSLAHGIVNVVSVINEERLTNKLYEVIEASHIKYQKKKLDLWFIDRKKITLNKFAKNYGEDFQYYNFINTSLIRGKRIVIYGAGKVGRDMIAQMSKYTSIDIVAWVDRNPDHYNYDFREVLLPAQINEYIFDYVIIAINNEIIYKRVKEELINNYNVSEEKIIWYLK